MAIYGVLPFADGGCARDESDRAAGIPQPGVEAAGGRAGFVSRCVPGEAGCDPGVVAGILCAIQSWDLAGGGFAGVIAGRILSGRAVSVCGRFVGEWAVPAGLSADRGVAICFEFAVPQLHDPIG